MSKRAASIVLAICLVGAVLGGHAGPAAAGGAKPKPTTTTTTTTTPRIPVELDVSPPVYLGDRPDQTYCQSACSRSEHELSARLTSGGEPLAGRYIELYLSEDGSGCGASTGSLGIATCVASTFFYYDTLGTAFGRFYGDQWYAPASDSSEDWSPQP